jgi:hypothetical protein
MTTTEFDGHADGETYEPERDRERLARQRRRVWDYMIAGRWRSLAAISEATGYPEASVSARLRDFRKARFGSHTVDRRYIGMGLWQYRLHVRAGGSHEGGLLVPRGIPMIRPRKQPKV